MSSRGRRRIHIYIYFFYRRKTAFFLLLIFTARWIVERFWSIEAANKTILWTAVYHHRRCRLVARSRPSSNTDSRPRDGTAAGGGRRNRRNPPRVTRCLPATSATGSRIRNPRTRTDRFSRWRAWRTEHGTSVNNAMVILSRRNHYTYTRRRRYTYVTRAFII